MLILRSHSGHNAGKVLSQAPTALENTVPPRLFRVLLLQRLAFPLPVSEARCSRCHEPLDPLGRSLAACPRTGGLKKACHNHRMLATIWCAREVHGISQGHERACSCQCRIDVLAQDLPCFGGAQLAVDIALRSVFWRTPISCC